MLATHRRIQESIFEGGNVVQFLRTTIEDRFGVKSLPDGFLFFPVELGGVGDPILRTPRSVRLLTALSRLVGPQVTLRRTSSNS
jgi:hypothetical protein